MKIGFSCNRIEPSFTQGKIDGIGHYTTYLKKALEGEKNIEIIPYIFPKPFKASPVLVNQHQFMYPYSVSALGSALLPSMSPCLYERSEKDFDLFHSTDYLIPKLKKPVVASLHDAVMLKHPEFLSSKTAFIKRFVMKKTAKFADHVIAISNSMVSEIVEYFNIPEEKISVTHLGISPEWFEVIPEVTKTETLNFLGVPPQFLLFVATLQPRKNLLRLIQAFRLLPEDIQKAYPLVIAGKAGWDMQETLAAINSLVEEKKGIWLNYVDHYALRCLFQGATLLVHPSLHEGFGFTLLEGFASQAPVITSSVASMPEIAGDAAYLVDPYSVDSIREAMFNVLTNSSLQESMIRKGLLRAKEFTWEKCAKETIKVYEKLL
jgi:glycosyltransferase involved in cell wall biosynthesis